MITIPQPFGGLVIPRGRVPARPVLTYIGRSVSATTSSSITFAGVGIGAAASDRLVVVSAMCNHNDNSGFNVINGGSIGGSAANLVVASDGMSYATACAILSRLVTSGTTANITITLNGNVAQTAIDVYTITGLASLTAFHTNKAQHSGSHTSSLGTTLNIPEGGCAIGSWVTHDAFNTYTHTWTGLTEDADSSAGLSYGGYTSASGQSMSAQTGRAISVTQNATSRQKAICVASWA